MQAKAIGILGLGSFSTLFYIKELNAVYNDLYDGYSTCPFKLLNTNFNNINNLLPHPSKELDTVVKNYLEQLQNLHVDAFLITNITLHETIDRLRLKTTIIHPIEQTVKAILKHQKNNVVVFGSLYTMESNYIKSYFTNNNIEVILASDEDRKFIDQVRTEVYKETATKHMLDSYNLLIEKYSMQTAVVIACTELSLAYIPTKLKVFDMARIQINTAIDSLRA